MITNASELRALLEAAWRGTVDDYRASHINSERTLQAVLHARLRAALPAGSFVLCEPVMDLAGVGRFVPDIVVVQDNDVVAIIELKFVPHHYPSLEDLRKLALYAAALDHFPLILDPTSGRFADTRFRLTKDCLLVFAVIGRHDAVALDETHSLRELDVSGGRFLHLRHATGGTIETHDLGNGMVENEWSA